MHFVTVILHIFSITHTTHIYCATVVHAKHMPPVYSNSKFKAGKPVKEKDAESWYIVVIARYAVPYTVRDELS